MKPIPPTLLSLLAGLAGLSGLVGAESRNPTLFPPSPAREADPHLERPVIFIPGTMGSRLFDASTARVAWGDFSRKAANGTTPEGQRGLALPMAVGRDLKDLRDGVLPTGALDSLRIELFPLLKVKASYYQGTFATFGSASRAGDVGATPAGFHVFPYDWRRSGDENAVQLGEFIAQLKRRLTRDGSQPPRFDLIAHSGGTQIARYYLRYGGQLLPRDGRLPVPDPDARKDIANLILLGPPNAGTLTGLMATANGHKGHPALPFYDRPIPGSMPGIYQLIPRARDHVLIDPKSGASLDPLDFDLWVERQWGLANPESDKALAVVLPQVTDPHKRREIALDHLRKCLAQARRYQAALDAPAPKPEGVRMMLVIGEGGKTPVTAIAHPGKLKEGEERDGDETVPSYSAWQLPYYEVRSGRRVAAGWDAVHRCRYNHDGVINEPKSAQAILRLIVGSGGPSSPRAF